MAISNGSTSKLAYIAETTWGTTPTTPTLVNLPYRTHGLDLQRKLIQSQTIQGDRIPRFSRLGTHEVAGPIEVDLCRGSYDALLESALMGAWSSDVLKLASTSKYFTIEDQAGIGQFRAYKGVTVNSLTVNIAPDQNVQATFNMLGRTMVQATSSVSGSGPTADGGYEPYDSYGAILEGGDALGIVTALNFTVDNSRSNVPVIGSDLSAVVDYGLGMVTGSITVLYQDKALIDKFMDETGSSLSVTVDDGTGDNSLQFVFPAIKYNGATTGVQNPKSRTIVLPFRAEYDETEGTNLKIVRSYA